VLAEEGAQVVRIAVTSIAAAFVLTSVGCGGGEGYPFADVPKGNLIAYAGPGGIRLVEAEGGGSWLVPGTGSLTGPEWAPDGERLAAVDLMVCCHVYSFMRDGSQLTRLRANTSTTPVWSPDGRRLAVYNEGDRHIHIRPVEDRRAETVLPLPGNDPAWSPDGRLVAFQSYAGTDFLRIYLVRPDGSGLRRLTSDVETATGASEAAWAPDGRRIAFMADFDGDEDIYVVRVDGTGLRKVTRNSVDDMTPTWSPDGRRIAFSRLSKDWETSAIVVVDLGTGAETEVAEGEDASLMEPSWQPAARR
jgi:Tol biopolymer transport system component